MKRTTHALLLLAGLLVACVSDLADASDGSTAAPRDSRIEAALLTYDNGKTAACFAPQFLTTYARNTEQNVREQFVSVQLSSDKLLAYPFAVFSGQEKFTLSGDEKRALKRYLDRGGFILASAGCSNSAWARSFEALIAELYGEETLTPLALDHALFHTVYDISHIDVPRPGGKPPVQGLIIDGRVRMLYSPLGLNDSDNAGGDCCCCGGSEIKNARFINVNALGYALTR